MPVVNEWEDIDQRHQEEERRRIIHEKKTMHLMRRSTSRSRSASERAANRIDHVEGDIQEGHQIQKAHTDAENAIVNAADRQAKKHNLVINEEGCELVKTDSRLPMGARVQR